jgi:hypothetical protein
MVCVATDSVDVTSVATPFDSVPVPNGVAPSLNVTVPVAVDGVTVAVNVTPCPKVEGVTEVVNAVLVDTWVTVCVIPAEVLAASFVSPAYTAVSV